MKRMNFPHRKNQRRMDALYRIKKKYGDKNNFPTRFFSLEEEIKVLENRTGLKYDSIHLIDRTKVI